MKNTSFLCLSAALLGVSLVACAVETESYDPLPSSKKSRGSAKGAAADPEEEEIPGVTPDGGMSTTPGGFNLGPNVAVAVSAGTATFALGTAAADAQGATMSATMTVTPSSSAAPKGSVMLSNFVIDNASRTALRFSRPTFLVQNAAEETVGYATFADVDLTVPAGRKSPFPKVTVLVEATGAKLRLVFGALQATSGTAITGLPAEMYQECKSPTSFSAVATHWTQNNCRNCHSGLFPYDFLSIDAATGCGLSRRLLGTGGPNLTRPTQGGHSGGTMANGAAYSQALTTWRNAER